jgi:predicted RecB family nuclease
MMASGEAVPLTVLEGVSTSQAETLAEKGIKDVEALAATTIDDLVEFLDVSFDEAETIITSAARIVEARNRQSETPAAGSEAEAAETSAAESEPSEAETEAEASEAQTEDSTASETVEPAEIADVSEPGPVSEAEDEAAAFENDAETPADEER